MEERLGLPGWANQQPVWAQVSSHVVDEALRNPS